MKQVLAAALLLLAGCAGMDVEKSSKGSEGIRYYANSPFLLVYADGKGGVNHKLLHLPDPMREMNIKPYAYLSKNEVELKFVNGVLTQGSSSGDATALPKALLGALKTIRTASLAADELDGQDNALFPPPALYRVVVDEHGIRLSGGYAMESTGTDRSVIRVPIRAIVEE